MSAPKSSFDLPSEITSQPMSDDLQRLLLQSQAEVEALIRDAAAEGFKLGVHAAAGPIWAPVLLALIRVGPREGRSNQKIADQMGLTRSAVSKREVQLRTNLGWPLRVPKNRRDGAHAKPESTG